jgi:site-specific recombinase XerD
MGRIRRSRKDLPPRVYVKHNAYYYVFPNGKWQRLAAVGLEREMRVAWSHLEQPNETYGTVAALLDEYLSQYAANAKAARTYKDNLKEAEYLKAFFGEMRPQDIQARHIGAYLEENRKTRAVRANREKALLSHVFTWSMRHPVWGCIVLYNPCKGVTRNPETKRIRIVEDAEYMSVFNLASKNVQRMMTLVYRTLQRPCDLLRLSSANVLVRNIDGHNLQVLSVRQSKTNAIVEIIMSEDIRQALYGTQIAESANSHSTTNIQNQFFILSREGKPYTSDGFNSVFADALNKYREMMKTNTGVKSKPFGIYDLKGKGATDMYQSGIALEYIQALAGHDSVTTTEIYIKARLNKPVMSNTRKICS